MAHGVYYQGAIFAVNDFDSYKTVMYFSKLYDVMISDELKVKLKEDTLTEKECMDLSRNFSRDTICKTAEELTLSLLDPCELADLMVDDAKPKLGSDVVYAERVENFKGEFFYDDEDKMPEELSEGMILAFNVPFVWDIRDAVIPADKRIAVFQLQEASKVFLKDDIDWENRLGYLCGIIE